MSPGMIHCPPASITSTLLRSSSATSGGSAPTLSMRLPSITMASLREGGLPEPSIKLPLRTTRVLLMDASRSRSLVQTLPPNRPASQPQCALSCAPSLSEGRWGRLCSRYCCGRCEVKANGLTIAREKEMRHGRKTVRPVYAGSRQYRQSRARQCLHQRPAPGDAVLHHRPRSHARSLSQHWRGQHVG